MIKRRDRDGDRDMDSGDGLIRKIVIVIVAV
jgi:hypothetical protein